MISFQGILPGRMSLVLGLVLATIGTGCHKQEETTQVSESTSTTQASLPAPSTASKADVDVTFTNDGFWGRKNLKLGGGAIARAKGGGFVIVFFDENLKGDYCKTEYGFGNDLGKDVWLLELRSSQPLAAGDVDGAGYSFFYPSTLDPKHKTTNSGNRASSVKLKLSKVTDEVVSGELSGSFMQDGSDPIKGTFQAKICK